MTPRSAFRRSRPFSSSMISLLVILAASVAAYAQPGKIYYVATTGSDSNPGSQEEPWLTISHAAKVARAGATVYVMGGVYNEIVNFPHSGTPPAPITFQSYPGQTAVLDGTGLKVSGTQGLITIAGNRSYLTISGFEIRNLTTRSANAVPCGVWITGRGTGIKILNNLIHDITTTARQGNACGLFAYGTSKTPISQLVVSGNELYDLKTGESESLTLNGNVMNFQVINNLVHDNYNIGIDIIGYEGTGPVGYDEASYGVVSGNTIYNISGIGNPGEGAEYDADGLYCDGCAFVTFERNVVFQVDYGIETTSENQVCLPTGTEWPGPDGVGKPARRKSPCYGRYATVRNNLFYEANSCGNSIGGYAQATKKGGGSNGGGSSFADVFVNNTLYDNGTQAGNDQEGTPSGDFQIQNQVGSAQGDYFENNLIYSGSPNIWINSFVPCSATYPCPPATLDWNLYYSLAGYEEGTSISWGGQSNFASFPGYQTASGEDANSLNANPQLIGIGDMPPNLYTQMNSPALAAGSTSLSCAVGWCDPNGSSPNSIYGSTDILGNPRVSGSSIDIGAYQNTGVTLDNTISVALSANTYTLQSGQTATLTTTVLAVPGGAGVPSGTVNYMLGSTLLASQTLMPTGPTTSSASMPISASQLESGTNSITAVYSGNSISPCCNPSEPPGGGTPLPVYPGATSPAIIITVNGSPEIYVHR